MGARVYYRDISNRHFKYCLASTYAVQTALIPDNAKAVSTPDGFVTLTAAGLLTIRTGYACDGPSGPTVDTKSFMRGAFVHDAAYQLIRRGLLPAEMRVVADRELHRMVLEDGMWRIRAWWVYHAVRIGGASSAKRTHRSPVLVAP